jgi:hypothetical protein
MRKTLVSGAYVSTRDAVQQQRRSSTLEGASPAGDKPLQ